MNSLLNSIALVCFAIKNGEGKIGRTKLQKMIYIVDKYLDWKINDFSLHFYGPYSSNIASLLQTIKSELIQENSGYGSYEYKLLDKGREFLDNFEENIEDKSKIELTNNVFKELSKWSKEELELVATLDFVNDNSLNPNTDIIQKVSMIKNKDINIVKNAHKKWIDWKKNITLISFNHNKYLKIFRITFLKTHMVWYMIG